LEKIHAAAALYLGSSAYGNSTATGGTAFNKAIKTAMCYILAGRPTKSSSNIFK